jgi:tRNA(Arg) A34 adenosine deaminase TadA
LVETDEVYMRMALDQAREAGSVGEVPIGAVVVCDGAVVAEDRNRREIDRDPTAHAELLAIRSAAKRLGRWRLSECTVYVTLEP